MDTQTIPSQIEVYPRVSGKIGILGDFLALEQATCFEPAR
jgi:hypothetical protein